MIPYGQECKECSKRKSEDDDSFYWMPFFDEAAILDTLADLHIKVEEKYYVEKTPENSQFITHGKTKDQLINHTRTLAFSNNNMYASNTRGHSYHNTRRATRQHHHHQQQLLNTPPPELYYYQDFNGAPMQGYLLPTPPQPYYQPTADGNVDEIEVPLDDDEESVLGQIGDGPHKQDLCEACKKGKCMLGREGVGNTSSQASGRQSRSGAEQGKRPPKSFNDIPDDVGNNNQNVKWYLTFENL